MANVTKDKLDRVYEAYRNGKLSRRHFLKYLGLAGASIGLVGSPFAGAVRDAWAAKSIRFDGWGGTVSEAFREYAFEPFTEATGIEVIDGEFGDMNTYLTRVKASFPPGGEFNIAHLSAVFDYARYTGLGFGVRTGRDQDPQSRQRDGRHDHAPARTSPKAPCRPCPTTWARPASPTTPSTSARRKPKSSVRPCCGTRS